ncbi:hypothetical protein EVAR_56088_1 [Eumeta japonica]|uniref:Uncharacterized protein n=1 Tax=Eumeta variegata TaxID=151549 RepID=A0A4C1YSS1_EUMVA|nr:hypothetical protein EVAR_56088_1 [Eumeta japonica]
MRNRRMSAMASQVITFHEETENRKERYSRINMDTEKKPMFLKNYPSTSSGSKERDRYIRSTRRRSTVTLIDSDLAQQTGARGRNEPYIQKQ